MSQRNREEEKLQSRCFQWHWNTFPDERQMLFHVDNNSWNDIIGALKKALGVVSGVSDLIYVLMNGRTAYIEMKTPNGSQSDAQFSFEEKLKKRHHFYFVVRTFEEFQDLIYNLLSNSN